MDELKLDMSSYLPLRDVVFNALRNAILRGDLKPGDRLMEMHLASKLGVSRTPIREAIRMLEQEGLAITEPRRGAMVAGMTEKDLEDVLLIRDALDELAVSLACENVNDEIIASLEASMKNFQKAIKGGNVKEIVAADEEFHNIIYRAADNRRLETIVNNLREQMYRYRYEYSKDKTVYSQLIDEHSRIIEGLKNQDVNGVKSTMHVHLENQVEAVRKTIRDQEKNNA